MVRGAGGSALGGSTLGGSAPGGLTPVGGGRLSPEELLGALDPQQAEVAAQLRGPLCVRAGAGTGKTRAITYRIAYGAAMGEVDPGTVLAVTFTNKAAAEMASRLRALGAGAATARTFHSAAWAQLSYFWPDAYGGDRPNLQTNKASLVTAAASQVGLAVDKVLIRDLAAEIEWSKVSIANAATYADKVRSKGRVPPGGLEAEEVARFLDAYEMAKDRQGAIDFEDILLLTVSMLQERPDIAAAVRARYASFVVDEYQDVSPIQQKLLDLWLGGRRDICVVGDVAQTIYSFTGATAYYLESFPKRVPGARVVELVRDYRSTPQVVAVANQVVGSARGMDGRSRRTGLPGAVHLVAQQPSGPAVRFETFDTEAQEAAEVAQRVKDLAARGVPLGQIAILYRTNSQSRPFEDALGDLGINYQIHGGARFFEREEVRRAVMLLRQQARIRQLSGEQGDTSLLELVQEVVAGLGWSPQAPDAEGAVRERWSNLDALVNMASQRPDFSLDQFVQELQERSASKAAPQVNGVVLSTLHAAKGLEWEAVFLVGVSEGLLPISLATTPEAIEEERRLLYVGITRAKQDLQISWSRAQSQGRSRARKVSRFLSDLWPSSTDPKKTRRLAAGTKRKAEERDFADSADPATLQLYQSLCAWRLATAKQMERAPYQVLSNTTLRDIAVAKPKTLRQLGVLRGIGDVKLSQFGGPLLQVVRDAEPR